MRGAARWVSEELTEWVVLSRMTSVGAEVILNLNPAIWETNAATGGER
jgi:hypothetical protein